VWQGKRLMGEVTRQDDDGTEYVVTAGGRIFTGNPREGYAPMVDDEEPESVAEGLGKVANNMANTNGVEDNMRRYGTKGYLMRVAVVLIVVLVVIAVLYAIVSAM
jgi:hypothetical protein